MPRKAASRGQAYLVTDARQSRSADIDRRERRYLVTMGIRLVCFLLAGLLAWMRAGWLAAIPAAGAIFLPYFAVVIANAGRGGKRPTGFRPYEPALPAPAADGTSSSSSSSAAPRPAERWPADGARAEGARAEGGRAEGGRAEGAPAEGAPAEGAPAEAAPADAAPGPGADPGAADPRQ